MRQILALFFFLTSTFFISDASAELVLPGADFSGLKRTGTAKVTEIVNPLTVKLDDGRFIHLAGLDFPDLDFYEPGDLSITAIEILNDFLKNKHVRIYQTKTKDKGRVNRMGHHIAHLARTDNDVWVQGLMLSLGLARVRTTLYNRDMATQMLNLEATARKERSALWGMEEFGVLKPENTEAHIGSYQIVEGTIKTVSMRKNTLYLNFGNNWRDDFTVALSKQNLRLFNKKNLNPQQWNGKKVRVRGWLESYNGAFIRIDHPERFELLFERAPVQQPEEPEIKAKDPGSALPVLNN